MKRPMDFNQITMFTRPDFVNSTKTKTKISHCACNFSFYLMMAKLSMPNSNENAVKFETEKKKYVK